MKFQLMAWGVTAVFGGAIAWIKFNGGKISAWLRVVSSLLRFGADLNDACSDGKATPEEMKQLCDDWNTIVADLGLAKKGAVK